MSLREQADVASLWSAAEAAAADRHTMEKLAMPSPVLMERASLAVAARAQKMLDAVPGGSRRILVLAGPGNNGGDGLAAARILAGRGEDVVVFLVTEQRNAAAKQQLELARAYGVTVKAGVPGFTDESALVVDAMLGTGARGAPRGVIAEAVAWCDGRHCLAIDLPTGVDADSGVVKGLAVQAQATVTFERSKPGLHITPGRSLAGAVEVAKIGLVAPPVRADAPRSRTPGLVIPAAVARVLDEMNVRGGATHKGQRGHVGLLAGGSATPGAAALAGIGALRAGAGLVTVRLADATARAALIGLRPELMTEEARGDLLPRATSLGVGPGLTDSSHGIDLRRLWADDRRPAVWDASALYEIPSGLLGLPGPRAITPHPGEAAGMLTRLGDRTWSSADVQAHRVDAACRLAELTGAVTVLKGAGTIIADPDGHVRVATEGGAELATAGTGDVLTGILAAFLSRGVEDQETLFERAQAAVHVHALAGTLAVADRPGPMALDVADAVDRARDMGERGEGASRFVERTWA